MKTRALGLSILLLFAAWASPVHAVSTSALSQELARTHQVGQRVVSFWWLPFEYWVAAAEELEQPAEEIDTISRIFRNYLIIAVIDARIEADGKLYPATPAEIGPKLEVRRNGALIEILRQMDPGLVKRLRELTYLLKTSLARLGPALRVFVLPNLDDQGRSLLNGTSTGTLAIKYLQGEEEDPLEFLWHAPLTSIVGPTRCPEGGEELEAHWLYCPWHGLKLR